MPDVIDFLVLRQFYDEARQRNWQSCKSILTEFYMPLKNDLFLSYWSIFVALVLLFMEDANT